MDRERSIAYRHRRPRRPDHEAEPSRPRSEDTFESARDGDRVVLRLLTIGIVEEGLLREAWAEWCAVREKGLRVPLWRVLTVMPDVDSNAIYAEAARIYAFEEAEVDEKSALAFIERHQETFTEEIWDRLIELFLIPIRSILDPLSGERRWVFVTHDPSRAEVHQLLQDLEIRRFELQYAPEAALAALITEAFLSRNEYLERLEEAPPIFDYGASFESNKESLVDEDALEAEIKRSTLINLFEAGLVEAVKRGASDLHIFPNADGWIEIHLRIDGELVLWHREERVRAEAFLAVVKDNAVNVDRFERDTAQDGFIQRWIDDTLIRFRVSVLPIASARQEIQAESIVIRVLDDRKVLTDLRKVGLLKTAYERFETAIRQPHGMVILTGPTGSGKSTTLVAALHQVVTPKVNVLTVEDPVEYIIRGVRQIKLGHRLDLDGALRAILRHDPDVVMVGEMRDRHTAELAVKLANTGHLTFSTLHTNDAPSAVSRLYKMGVEPFLIAYAINLIVAQRLIRKLCDTCRVVEEEPDRDLLMHLGLPENEAAEAVVYAPGRNADCPVCKGLGYKGRRAIAETMMFSQAIRRQIMQTDDLVDEDVLRETAVSEGMLTLRDSALRLVLLGETSLPELLRVTGQ